MGTQIDVSQPPMSMKYWTHSIALIEAISKGESRLTHKHQSGHHERTVVQQKLYQHTS